jgi:hypothetical protein
VCGGMLLIALVRVSGLQQRGTHESLDELRAERWSNDSFRIDRPRCALALCVRARLRACACCSVRVCARTCLRFASHVERCKASHWKPSAAAVCALVHQRPSASAEHDARNTIVHLAYTCDTPYAYTFAYNIQVMRGNLPGDGPCLCCTVACCAVACCVPCIANAARTAKHVASFNSAGDGRQKKALGGSTEVCVCARARVLAYVVSGAYAERVNALSMRPAALHSWWNPGEAHTSTQAHDCNHTHCWAHTRATHAYARAHTSNTHTHTRTHARTHPDARTHGPDCTRAHAGTCTRRPHRRARALARGHCVSY